MPWRTSCKGTVLCPLTEGSIAEVRTGIKFPKPHEVVEGLKKDLSKGAWTEALTLAFVLGVLEC